MDGKIVTNPKVNKYISLGLMCKTMRCLPTDIRKQNYEDMVYLHEMFSELAKKNPMSFLTG